jgi:hypothetical protein
MTNKEAPMDLRSDADLQAIQTSVAFKNISDAVEQYRRQFGLAFLALIAFSAIHVGLVVIANLYTMQTRVSRGVLTDAADSTISVATGASGHTYDLAFIMTNMDEKAQLHALNNFDSASFVDRENTYRQYTVTGYQLGGWKRSELKLYTSVGHILEYVRGKGIRLYSESGSTSNNCTSGTESRRKLQQSSAVSAIVDSEYYMSTSTLSDAAKDAVISDKLPKLKKTVSAAADAAKNQVLAMAKNGWSTDTDDWEGLIIGAIGKNFGSGLASQYKTAYWSDAVQSKADGAAFASWAANQPPGTPVTIPTAMGDCDLQDMAHLTHEECDEVKHNMIYTHLYVTAAGEPDGAMYGQTGIGMYMKGIADNGGYDGYVLSEALDIIAGIKDSTAMAIDNWDVFTSTGYIGAVVTKMKVDDSSMYGCYTKSMAEFEGMNTNGGEMIESVCYGPTEGKLMGGFFFSQIMGTFEAFIMQLPIDYCEMFGAASYYKSDGKGGYTMDVDFGVSYKEEFFLYLMHGWGESGIVLVEAADTIFFLQASGNSINFLTIVAEDNGSPYGGKTWYVNNVFTGYHQDMIVFELPEYLEYNMGLKAWQKGIYGFSMGAAGSLNIGFTYSNIYGAIAAFNGPIDADECFICGYCHVYCGVDSFKCEIMWMSPMAAYNPYVIVAVGGFLETLGFYDPSAYGVATKTLETGITQCTEDHAIVGLKPGLLVDAMHEGAFGEGITYHVMDGGIWDYGQWAAPDFGIVVSEAAMWDMYSDPYFYLDPIKFTRSSSGFDPSHNPTTGAVNWEAFYSMYYQLPLQRAMNNKGLFNHGVTFFLIACDFNDQYGLSDMAFDLAGVFTGYRGGKIMGGIDDKYGGGAISNGYSMSGGSGVIHDAHQGCGHCMDLRDFRLAYAFMSDVFDTMGNDGNGNHDGKWHGSGAWMPAMYDSCAYYMSHEFLNVQSYIGYLDVSYNCLPMTKGDAMSGWSIYAEWGGDPMDKQEYKDMLVAAETELTTMKGSKSCFEDSAYDGIFYEEPLMEFK